MPYTIPNSAPLLTFFQWGTPLASNPSLVAPLFPSDTTVYFSSPPYDHSGAIVSGNFLMGVKNNDSYVMTCYIPAGGVAADGLSATVVQGIRLEGLDYTTSDTSLIPAEGFSAGDAIFCNISGIIQALTMGAIRGTIATNGLGLIMGDGTASNATISHLDNVSAKGFLRKNPTTSKVQYSNDGTNWVNIDSVSASNLIQVSAGDTTPGYAETKIVAGNNISVTKLNAGGNESLQIATSLPTGVAVPETYTSAYLTGDNTAESNYLLWGALVDGSFRITIDGVLRNIAAISTVGTVSMADIASRIQVKLRIVTGGLETVTWVTNHFVIASANTTVSSAITVASATGSGTDISGAGAFGGLGCDTGHGVITASVLNQTADSGKVLLLGADGRVNPYFIPRYIDGGTGADGALNITTGTTTLNLGQVYNFSSINISAGATLAFTGTTGAAMIKCMGDITGTGTIELRNSVTSTPTDIATSRYLLKSSNAATPTSTPNVGGAIGAAQIGNGALGGTSTTASGTPGVGGAGGGADANGTAGSGGNNVGGGGGGGGGGSYTAVGTGGSNCSGNNGGAGGKGGDSTNSRAGGGGGGGGGYLTGNGGIGGAGGLFTSSYGSPGDGGSGGASGSSGGNGGNGGTGGNMYSTGTTGNGGNGGWGYALGGTGGLGGNSAYTYVAARNGGNGGNSSFGNGGAGGAGGDYNTAGALSGNGGIGGNGRNGGAGGNAGYAPALAQYGNGGAGGHALCGIGASILNIGGNHNFTGTINAQGGNGGAGGTGGSGGAGGNASRGADVVILVAGTKGAGCTINNNSGVAGAGGLGVAFAGSKNGAAGVTYPNAYQYQGNILI